MTKHKAKSTSPTGFPSTSSMEKMSFADDDREETWFEGSPFPGVRLLVSAARKRLLVTDQNQFSLPNISGSFSTEPRPVMVVARVVSASGPRQNKEPLELPESARLQVELPVDPKMGGFQNMGDTPTVFVSTRHTGHIYILELASVSARGDVRVLWTSPHFELKTARQHRRLRSKKKKDEDGLGGESVPNKVGRKPRVPKKEVEIPVEEIEVARVMGVKASSGAPRAPRATADGGASNKVALAATASSGGGGAPAGQPPGQAPQPPPGGRPTSSAGAMLALFQDPAADEEEEEDDRYPYPDLAARTKEDPEKILDTSFEGPVIIPNTSSTAGPPQGNPVLTAININNSSFRASLGSPPPAFAAAAATASSNPADLEEADRYFTVIDTETSF
jgi:hypothetical protein